MRLTLRTLLAHLDRTLDPEDDAAIAAKLRESEFASKLAQRVRDCMRSDLLEAPSTLATGTADDPNRIGEYLDSVLSAEQVAEVERICLESDMHLAEVAACHQILTIVLAKPAEIPFSLRNKLYELGGELRTASATTNGTFAGPVAASAAELAMSETLVSPAAAMPVNVPPISPVGPDDSGVSDAPTRLKGAAVMNAAGADAALAGYKKLSPADLADYAPRPSRVMPWLVSLALVAAFLFVASLAFAPLLRHGADQERLLTRDDPPAVAVDRQPDRPEPQSAPVTRDDDIDAVAAVPSPAPQPSDVAAAAPQPERVTDAETVEPSAAVADAAPATPAAEPAMPAPSPALGDIAAAPRTADVPPTPTPPAVAPAVAAPPADIDPVEEQAPIVVTSDGSLLLIRDADSDTWVLSGAEDVVLPESELICPPLYRDRLSLHEEAELTMIGPARVTLRPASGQTAEVELQYGRFLLVGLQEQRQLSVRFEDTDSLLTLPDPESVAAIEVISLRPPGLDPENENSTHRVIQVLAAQGNIRWRAGNRPEVTLETGQLLTLGRGNQVSLSDVSSIPAWLDEPVEAVASIESSARQGLLGLVRGNEAIELSLREAMDFRRTEVAALAARTMLLLDRHDVYFGSEGVFSQPRQRTYWPDHFNAVLSVINRGPAEATAVRRAIQLMDAAQADEIFRLLWLFSDNQLVAGADETLVRALDNPNMTVRVLAAENLRHITGNTLLYKPEAETSARRSSDIKKWETRLRRGEIRWTTSARPAGQPAAAGQPGGAPAPAAAAAREPVASPAPAEPADTEPADTEPDPADGERVAPVREVDVDGN